MNLATMRVQRNRLWEHCSRLTKSPPRDRWSHLKKARVDRFRGSADFRVCRFPRSTHTPQVCGPPVRTLFGRDGAMPLRFLTSGSGSAGAERGCPAHCRKWGRSAGPEWLNGGDRRGPRSFVRDCGIAGPWMSGGWTGRARTNRSSARSRPLTALGDHSPMRIHIEAPEVG